MIPNGKIKLTSNSQKNPSPEIELLLEEFNDVILEDVPDGLSLMCDIQHVIDLVPESLISDLPHYRLNPKEREKIKRQVDGVLQKVHI